MSCDTCRLWLGKNVAHDICPLKADLRCRRCCGSGHSSSECTMNSHAIYPEYIEELIPTDLREIYGINTLTTYNKPSADFIAPIHPVRKIDIINSDKWIREFMKQQKLQTARKREDNLTKIFDWAHGSGLSIHLINE